MNLTTIHPEYICFFPTSGLNTINNYLSLYFDKCRIHTPKIVGLISRKILEASASPIADPSGSVSGGCLDHPRANLPQMMAWRLGRRCGWVGRSNTLFTVNGAVRRWEEILCSWSTDTPNSDKVTTSISMEVRNLRSTLYKVSGQDSRCPRTFHLHAVATRMCPLLLLLWRCTNITPFELLVQSMNTG